MKELAERLAASAVERWPEVYAGATELCLSVYDRVSGNPEEKLLAFRQALLHQAMVACDACEACELSSNRYGASVFADGIVTAGVFVIGEGPGQYEQRTLVPFTHVHEYRGSRCFLTCAAHDKCFPEMCVRQRRTLPAIGCSEYVPIPREESLERNRRDVVMPYTVSQLLNKALTGLFTRDSWNGVAAIKREPKRPSELYITNTVKCRSMDERGDDKPPAAGPLRACRKWLDIQLAIVQPEVLILIGGAAGQFVFGPKYKVLAERGKFRAVEGLEIAAGLPGSVRYIGTAAHPSWIARQSSKRQEEEVQMLRRVFASGLEAVNLKKSSGLEKAA